MISKLICFFFGHKRSVPMLKEDNLFIFDEGCPRCKEATRLAVLKKIPPPPNSNQQQIESWNEYLENKIFNTRTSCINKMIDSMQ